MNEKQSRNRLIPQLRLSGGFDVEDLISCVHTEGLSEIIKES